MEFKLKLLQFIIWNVQILICIFFGKCWSSERHSISVEAKNKLKTLHNLSLIFQEVPEPDFLLLKRKETSIKAGRAHEGQSDTRKRWIERN